MDFLAVHLHELKELKTERWMKRERASRQTDTKLGNTKSRRYKIDGSSITAFYLLQLVTQNKPHFSINVKYTFVFK